MGRTDGTRSTETGKLRQQVALLVPGYAGYAAASGRRDNDGRMRVELCERIDRANTRLEDFLLDISEDGWTAGVEGIDRTIRRLEDLRDIVTRSAENYRGIMSLGDLEEERTRPLLEVDLGLLVELDALGEFVSDLGTPHFTTGLRKGTLAEMDRRLDEIEGALKRRSELAREIGNDGDA
jgi:hypothetical protein